MKSSLKNMVLVLFCITLISSACVGLVNMITVEPIARAKEAAVKAALAEVLPEFDATEKSEHTADELLIVAHKATKDGEVVGYAIETVSKNGFSGLIKMMVGFDTAGTILNVNVLEQNETPGLGAKGAERIVLELKDKFKGVDIGEISTEEVVDVYHGGDTETDEAVSALVVLGYSTQEAKRAVSGLRGSVEEIIKEALKKLMKG